MILHSFLRSQNVLFGIFWLLFFKTQAQSLSGQVLSLSDRIPVPFASITTQKHKWGLNAGEDGTFFVEDNSIMKNFGKGDTLLISSLGYFELRIPYEEIQKDIKVYLRESSIQLSEVKIKNDSKFKDILLGSKENTTNSGTGHPTYQNMQEIALWIPNYIQNEGYINKVGYWIMKSGKPKTPFRVRIYKYDHGMPGEDLLKENLVVHARHGEAWLDVDVSQYNIPFPADGFFISMEWLLVPNKKFFTDVKWPNGGFTSEFGQEAGTTREFAPGYGRIRNNGGHWQAYRYVNNPRPMFRAQVRIYE